VTNVYQVITLVGMESPIRQELREARTVEIAFSVIVGVVVCGVLSVGVLLTGWLGGLSSPTWEIARYVALVVALALGVGTAVWLLVRARRRGL
jgi:hypothetical protein